MSGIESATKAVQLLMRLHKAEYWQSGADGSIQIAVPMKGRDNPTEWRTISPEMLQAAQLQVDTEVPALRGELNFQEPPKRRRTGPDKYDRRKVRR